MKASKKARIMFILSMVIFGTISLCVRSIALPSSEVALFRATLASILIICYLIATKQKLVVSNDPKQLMLLLFSGAAMGFNWILLFEAYKYTTVSIATLSYYFAPVIVTVVSPILFKEKMGMKQWLCFTMSTLGIILITGIGDLGQGSSHLVGILLGLGAAVLYATVILINKFIKDVEGIHRTLLQFLSATIVLFPYVLVTNGITVQTLDTTGWIYLLIVGFIHTGITYCMYFTSLKELTGQQVALLSYIDPLVAVMLSVTVLQESITWIQVVGGILILSFTLYNELSSSK